MARLVQLWVPRRNVKEQVAYSLLVIYSYISLNHMRRPALIINPSDEIPIYRQIVRQVQEDIAQGGLTAGDKLPSHRELATELVIAPLTVKRAYDELEGQGLIATERGRGTFVTGALPGGDLEEEMRRIRKLAERLLSAARIANIDYETVVRILDDVKKRGGA